MATLTFNSQEFFVGTHTWNVPALCSGFIIITGVGAGGGGGRGAGAATGGGGGGGAGQSIQGQFYKVTPGGTLVIKVGAGGISETITPVGVRALYPWATNFGGTDTGLPAAYSRNGGIGGGDGGGITTVGNLIILPGAGGARGGDGGGGGMGGGARQWGVTAPHGNEGFKTANQGGAGLSTLPKDSNCFQSGPGGGCGSGGNGGRTGGAGGTATWHIAQPGGGPGGTLGLQDGAGGGAASWYADGGAAGAALVPGGPAGRGAGGGGGGGTATGDTSGGVGGDGYILIQWYELDP